MIIMNIIIKIKRLSKQQRGAKIGNDGDESNTNTGGVVVGEKVWDPGSTKPKTSKAPIAGVGAEEPAMEYG